MRMLGRNRPIARGRALRLKNYLMRGYPTPPASIDWTPLAKASIDQVFLNDRLGDCVIAWGAHMEGILTGNSSGTPIIYTDAQIIAQYSAIGGYQGTAATDNGCDEVTALNYWDQHGFAGGTKISGWIRVDATDPVEVRAAIYLFGSVTFGIELPDEWAAGIDTLENGFEWDVAGPADEQNGHCFGGGGYEPGRIKIVEWGMTGWITDAAVAMYAATRGAGEMYTVLSTDWMINSTSKAPNGFNWTQLASDLASMA
jgi:hypothetical protein